MTSHLVIFDTSVLLAHLRTRSCQYNMLAHYIRVADCYRSSTARSNGHAIKTRSLTDRRFLGNELLRGAVSSIPYLLFLIFDGAHLIQGIELKTAWWDAEVTEFSVSCSNSYYSGQTSIYASLSDLHDLAEGLAGFPSHIGDRRDFELGTFDPKFAEGGIRMHFYCLDSSGHTAVEVQLRGGGCTAMGEVESVALRIPLEAAAIDDFVAQLRSMKVADGAAARLEMAK